MTDLLTVIQSAYLQEGAITIGRIVQPTGRPQHVVAREVLPLLLSGDVHLRDDRKIEPLPSREVANAGK